MLALSMVTDKASGTSESLCPPPVRSFRSGHIVPCAAVCTIGPSRRRWLIDSLPQLEQELRWLTKLVLAPIWLPKNQSMT